MAWDHTENIFPTGFASLPNGKLISTELLPKSEIKTIYRDIERQANDMTVWYKRYVWGADGEFKILNLYNVYDNTSHVDDEHYPLNVYGQAMLNDYLAFNNIDIKKYDIK